MLTEPANQLTLRFVPPDSFLAVFFMCSPTFMALIMLTQNDIEGKISNKNSTTTTAQNYTRLVLVTTEKI